MRNGIAGQPLADSRVAFADHHAGDRAAARAHRKSAADRGGARHRHRDGPAHSGRRVAQSRTVLRTGQFVRFRSLSRHQVGRNDTADQSTLRAVRQARRADRRGAGGSRGGRDRAQGRPAADPVRNRDRVSERARPAAKDPDPRRSGGGHRPNFTAVAASCRRRRGVSRRNRPCRSRLGAGQGRSRANEGGACERPTRTRRPDGRYVSEVRRRRGPVRHDRSAAIVPGCDRRDRR